MPSNAFSRFQKRLVLAAYVRRLFGVRDPEDAQAIRHYHDALRATEEGFHPDGTSHLARALQRRTAVRLSDARLRRYDDNVRTHTAALNARRAESITWRYFQHLAGLMTEHYLHRLKHDPADFAADINAFAERRNEHRTYIKYPTVSTDDLNKLAFWMATGSGKTLLMHLHHYQYRHYFGDDLDHSLLVTPNSGLTDQHMAALRRSGIPCRYYRDLVEGGATASADAVTVIEISKLVAEKTDEGVRVEADAFEGNNLVFVDEGHKGTGSAAGTWRDLRARLAEGGFTFEYSATFGQAVSGSTPAAVEEEYGKAILFDYSYRRFHEDGYGKDYQILNLDPKADEALAADNDLTHRYLLANLLTFYEQQVVFDRDEARLRDEYNLKKPLLLFVGHSVTGGRTVSDLSTNDRRSVTDMQRLVAFLHRVLTDTTWARSALERLLAEDGALEINGQSLFSDAFGALRALGGDAGSILDDLRDRLFHASGGTGLRLVNLTSADGEIGLRAGDADRFFGVIDVGNERGFLDLMAADGPDVSITESTFEGSLFKRINRSRSDINVLMGAKKFIEGWSSWRVSTMGLMNIGRGEGPQIIQLFGRGVRLLGKHRSLKRSSALDEDNHPRHLPLLETLNIFGVRADYMAQFRDSLADEGIETEDRKIVRITTEVDDRFRGKDLQVPRPRSPATFTSTNDLVLALDDDVVPEIDLMPTGEALRPVEEGDGGAAVADDGASQRRTLDPALLPLLDWARIYRSLWRYRDAQGYTNLTFDRATLREIIETEHYDLYCPAERIEFDAFAERDRIASIVLRILRTYITAFYARRKQAWERKTLAYEPLTEDDDLLVQVIEARVEDSADAFLDELRGHLERTESDDNAMLFAGDEALYTGDSGPPSRVHLDQHLYQPLLTQEDEPVTYRPSALSEDEQRFVEHLRAFLDGTEGEAFVEGRELYVLRNRARGRGVRFQMQDGGRFRPDFLLWLLEETRQHVLLVDTKGMNGGAGHVDVAPKVRFGQNIDDYQRRLNDRAGRNDVRLHACIASGADGSPLRDTQASAPRQAVEDRRIYVLDDGPAAIQRMLGDIVG